MENPGLNHPPEVNSSLDDFVESSAETQSPSAQISEQAKPLDCIYKTQSESDCSNRQRHEIVETSETEPYKTEKTQKLESFPVALSETVKFNNSEGLEKVADKSCTEQAETAILNVKEASNETSIDESACSKIKGQAQEEAQSSEKGGDLDASATHEKEILSTKVVEGAKTIKPESAEVKRKNPKRTFKTEKEFLEFTLKYHQVLTERDAAIVVRDRLESLCRELQRQNKMLMDECKRVSTEGQSLRTELSVKFQDAIKDVSIKLEEQKDECLAQLKENETLRNKLKQLIDQFAFSEQQFAQKLKQKTLELQIADLKTKQCEEKLIQEQSQMKSYAEQISQLLATEKNLRLQLTADGEKFQQFQDALLKSNEVFETFKQEIEKMTKSIKELKKENSFLKSKCEKSDVTLIELLDEREGLKKQLEKTKNQKEKLESLCRSLQAERKQSSMGSNSSDSTSV
ncbi:beta-taxilin [Cucurbita moschata]|uniref:Beta-taxilin n=1 Tax=Cucurbita moschata TaxID=3662 RepID=A0A6J1HM05_CUCMO|nr:beta-taxilin [Cucurbita moschata]XP_022964803.1 beta-taxilin [Cucurbita moschata]XP_022964813.1 beta-taxilin [Cucurbita moschata]